VPVYKSLFLFSIILVDFMLHITERLDGLQHQMTRVESFLEQMVSKDSPGMAVEVLDSRMDRPVQTEAKLEEMEEKLQSGVSFRSKLVSVEFVWKRVRSWSCCR
jgi:hypothetical protein